MSDQVGVCIELHYGIVLGTTWLLLSGSFGNDDDDGSANNTVKMNSRFLRQISLESNSCGAHPSLETKRKLLPSCVYSHRTSHEEISRCGRVVTAKKCTKTCAARTKLLLCIINLLRL